MEVQDWVRKILSFHLEKKLYNCIYMNPSLVVALFVIGNLVGSGFFMLPSLLAPIGSNLFYSWAIAGSMAIMFAFMFGRLYVLFPESSVLSDYFNNPIFKKVIAMVYWVSCIIGNTGVLIIIVASLKIPYPIIVGGVVITLLTLANGAMPYKNIAKIEILLTILKFFILALLPLSLFIFNSGMFCLPKYLGTQSQVVATGISCFWAFLGIETASVFGSGRAARKGLLIGVISCAILYVVTSLLIVSAVPANELMNSNMPFALFVNTVFGPGMEKYIAFLIAFTAFGALYGWVAATSKMSLIYAQTNVFPKQFLKKAHSQTSLLGLILSSLASLILFICVSDMNINKQFLFVSDITVYITFAIYGFCAYILLRNAKNYWDYVIAFSGMLSVFISFMFDYKLALIALSVLIITGLYIAFFSEKKKIS